MSYLRNISENSQLAAIQTFQSNWAELDSILGIITGSVRNHNNTCLSSCCYSNKGFVHYQVKTSIPYWYIL